MDPLHEINIPVTHALMRQKQLLREAQTHHLLRGHDRAGAPKASAVVRQVLIALGGAVAVVMIIVLALSII